MKCFRISGVILLVVLMVSLVACTAVPPTADIPTQVAQAIAATETAAPTDTAAPSGGTPPPVTDTPPSPADTLIPVTDTPIPPSETPTEVPPTDTPTPIPPTDTATPLPTESPTEAPPTDTPMPESTATPKPTPKPKPPAAPRGILLYSNANVDADQWELWEYDFGSGQNRMLHAWRTEVDFSNDGNQIAYYRWADNRDDAGIWIMNKDYSGERKILPGGAYPSFSPGGDRLSVMGDQIYIVHSDGGGLRPLIQGEYPAWSPIDNRIAFRSCFGGDCGIWITDADAGGQARVTTWGSDGQPAWSANGNKIAFISQEEGNFEIYTVNSDGANIKRLTNRPASDGLPVWSPDGKWIAWRSDAGGTWGVWVMRSDGTDQRRLFDAPVLEAWFWEKMARRQ